MELGPTLLTLQTLEGHPLAGAVRFDLGPVPASVDTGVLRFQVQVYDRAANVVDWLAMATVGGRMQNATWQQIVENVVRESGGEAPAGVESDEATLGGAEAEQVEGWLRELAESRRRERNDV